MKKILVTGFDPFGGEKVNPAFEAVKLLPDEIKGVKILKLEIPTVFEKSGLVLKEAIKINEPDAVLCIGQAGGRSFISIEKVAINLGEARIADNEGRQPSNVKLEEDGETAYFTNLPVKAMVKQIQDKGIPAHISYTAGTFVCNDIMYRLLYMINTEFKNLVGGFIHVPYDIAQVVNKPVGTASMPIVTISQAIEAALEAIIENKEDIDVNGAGETH